MGGGEGLHLRRETTFPARIGGFTTGGGCPLFVSLKLAENMRVKIREKRRRRFFLAGRHVAVNESVKINECDRDAANERTTSRINV